MWNFVLIAESTEIQHNSTSVFNHEPSLPLSSFAVWCWSRPVYKLEPQAVSWATLWVTVTLALCLDSSNICIKIDAETERDALCICEYSPSPDWIQAPAIIIT